MDFSLGPARHRRTGGGYTAGMNDPDLPGVQATTLARVVLAPNAGPMTLDGTNTFVLRAPGSESVVVVDPGPSDAGHLARLAGFGRVELVLVTHNHLDHTESLTEFARMTDAPVRAIDVALCIGGDPLVDGERIEAAGLAIEVVATPGHTADSVCFALPGDTPLGSPAEAGGLAIGSVLTGDTILGRGTTIIADPDGALGPYLESLARLRALAHARPSGGAHRTRPGTARPRGDLRRVPRASGRATRPGACRAAALGDDATTAQVTDVVYADTDASVRFAAEASVRAQLRYLRGTD